MNQFIYNQTIDGQGKLWKAVIRILWLYGKVRPKAANEYWFRYGTEFYPKADIKLYTLLSFIPGA